MKPIIEFYEDNLVYNSPKLLQNPTIDGIHKQKMSEYLSSSMGKRAANSIFANAYQGLNFLATPIKNDKNLSKILCLGKVQSGKTSFFIASISMAFDNGYDIAYLIGGTKTKLKDQNFIRVAESFENNENVKVYDLNSLTTPFDRISEDLKKGYKIILVVLKNTALYTNLGLLFDISNYFSEVSSIIIDDEGDEFSPGAPKLKSKNPRAGVTHDSIVEIIENIQCCTFMSVTATPQANLLLGTMDKLSPDYLVLVKPGEGYTGGNSFHDTTDNKHVVIIKDEDDFKDSIPKSFQESFLFFILACCIQRYKKSYLPYSMIVHPSSLKRIHKEIKDRIYSFFEDMKKCLIDHNSFAYESALSMIKKEFQFYCETNNVEMDFNAVACNLNDVLENVCIAEVNSDNTEEGEDGLYKVYIGGNMLGRGLTIKNLIVSYIYRDSKETAIDTLYQRARWFGYKKNYFDVCKVYMTENLSEKFIATVDSENDMWNSIENYLFLNINIKRMPRLFRLENDKLILTRKTVARTISISRINPGYSYDKSVYYEGNQKEENLNLYKSFIDKYDHLGKYEKFDTEGYQNHFVIKMKYSEFYDQFLARYNFPKGSDFGKLGFSRILNNINNKSMDDEIFVVVMRRKTKQYRSLETQYMIKELPQSYNNGTNYQGDKLIYNDKLSMQIHLVYTDKTKPDDYIPMIAFNNPITKTAIRYVTGDGDYEKY